MAIIIPIATIISIFELDSEACLHSSSASFLKDL